LAQITLGGLLLGFTVYLWRDFQNQFSKDQVISIGGAIHVMAPPGTPMPPTVRALSAWVSAGDCVWATSIDERTRGGNTIEAVLHGIGPAWGPNMVKLTPGTPNTDNSAPDMKVDVVISVTDGTDTGHLAAAGVPIQRTW
jgi:hypothetical protein